MFIFTAVCAAVNSTTPEFFPSNSTTPEFFPSDKPRTFLDSQVWCEQHNASLARLDSLENEVEARKVIFQYLKHFHEVPPSQQTGKGVYTWEPSTLVSGSGTKLNFLDLDLFENPIYPESLGFWIGVLRPSEEFARSAIEILLFGFLYPASFTDQQSESKGNYPWLSQAPKWSPTFWVSKHDSWFAFAWYDDTEYKYWERAYHLQTSRITCMSWSCVYATPYSWLPGNCTGDKKMALCERDALPKIPVDEMAKFLTKDGSCDLNLLDGHRMAADLSLFQLSIQMVIFVFAVLRFVLLVTISLRQIQKLKEEGKTTRVVNDWNSPLAASVATISGTYIATDTHNATWSALIRTFVPAGALLMVHFNGPRWPEENFLATMIALMYFAAQNACMSAAGYDAPAQQSEYIQAGYASWAVIFVVYLGSLGVATWFIAGDYCFYWGLPFGSALITSAIATFLKWKGTCSNAIKAYRNLASNIADVSRAAAATERNESPVQSRTATTPDGNVFKGTVFARFIPEFLVVIAYVTLSVVFCLVISPPFWMVLIGKLVIFWLGLLGLVVIWGLTTAIVSVPWSRCAAWLRNRIRWEDEYAVTELTQATSNSSPPSLDQTVNGQPGAAVRPQFDNKIEELDHLHNKIVELVESINSIFTIPLLVVIIIFATLGFFERSPTLSISYFAISLGVVAIAASLGDDYTAAKAYVLGPNVSRSLAKLMQDPEQYSAYRDGLKQSLLGVQLFNLVVTTPRLLSSAFGLAFIKTAFEILKSLGFMSSEHA